MDSVHVFNLVRSHWQYPFLEADLKTFLPCEVYFTADGKLTEMDKRVRALKHTPGKYAEEYDITAGRGSLRLHLKAQWY